MKKVLIFGVFDGFHKGHEYFVTEALKRAGERQLVLVLTTDEIAEQLKKRRPKNSYASREAAIQNFNADLLVIPGDSTLGSWNVLKEHRPEIVFLGYDQQSIAAELKKMNIIFEFIDSHEPTKYKSSLL